MSGCNGKWDRYRLGAWDGSGGLGGLPVHPFVSWLTGTFGPRLLRAGAAYVVNSSSTCINESCMRGACNVTYHTCARALV